MPGGRAETGEETMPALVGDFADAAIVDAWLGKRVRASRQMSMDRRTNDPSVLKAAGRGCRGIGCY